MNKLVIFSGPPGVGKSTSSYRLAQKTSWALLTRDQIDRSLEHVGIVNKDAGLEILLGLTKINVQNNVSVILDWTFSKREARKHLKQIVEATNTRVYVIVCICSDFDLWKKRIETRPEVVEGWTPADWKEAQRVHGFYEKWEEPHLILDSINPFEDNFRKLLEYIETK